MNLRSLPSLKICAVLSKYCYLVLIIVMKLEEIIDYFYKTINCIKRNDYVLKMKILMIFTFNNKPIN